MGLWHHQQAVAPGLPLSSRQGKFYVGGHSQTARGCIELAASTPVTKVPPAAANTALQGEDTNSYLCDLIIEREQKPCQLKHQHLGWRLWQRQQHHCGISDRHSRQSCRQLKDCRGAPPAHVMVLPRAIEALLVGM